MPHCPGIGIIGTLQKAGVFIYFPQQAGRKGTDGNEGAMGMSKNGR